jgi:hypothetical protein
VSYRQFSEAHPTSTIWSTNKPATVKLDDGTKVKLFAEEAAEIYFSDYGEGQLTNGKTHIDLLERSDNLSFVSPEQQ